MDCSSISFDFTWSPLRCQWMLLGFLLISLGAHSDCLWVVIRFSCASGSPSLWALGTEYRGGGVGGGEEVRINQERGLIP